MVQIGAGDDEVRVLDVLMAVAVRPADAGHVGRTVRVLRADPGDLGTRDDPRAGILGQRRQPLDDTPEAALRIQNALVEVERAHQVVHRRRRPRVGAQEDGGVAEDLPQHRVPEAPGGESLEAGAEQREQSRQRAHHLGSGERPGAGERVVEEVPPRHGAGIVGGGEIGLECRGGARFHRLEQRGHGFPPGGHRHGSSPDSGERKTRYPGSSSVRSSCSSVLVPIIAK